MKNGWRQRRISTHSRRKTDLSSLQENADKNYFIAHIGSSMNPTLSKRDILEIEPCNHNRPIIGDIILFQVPHYFNFIIHRIFEINPEGYKTKGDNCDSVDPWVLQRNDVFGRVIAAHQGNKRRKISGGSFGRLTGLSCLMRRKINGLMVKLLRPAYRSFCTDGILHWLIPVRLTPQVATFRSDANASHKLLLRRRIIGSYDEAFLRWRIRRPYRLFVDEKSLPKPQ